MSKIMVISHGDGSTMAYRDIVFANHRRYCQRHGYQLIHDTSRPKPGRTGYWTKIHLIQQHLHMVDWLMWIDCDAMFMNHDVKLETILLDEHRDMILSRSPDVPRAAWINTGVFFIRDTLWVRHFLDVVWTKGEVLKEEYDIDRWGCYCRGEQSTMIYFLQTMFLDDIDKHVRIYPSHVFNAREYTGGRSFIVHFPGANKAQRIASYLSRAPSQVRYRKMVR
ncbi:hypothetical protein HED60_13880 [Planctomycetales bacterium ZRK34]|nr:hypothetical protein HED60_13880 [Planctomycetales bacterium ZRK34]